MIYLLRNWRTTYLKPSFCNWSIPAAIQSVKKKKEETHPVFANEKGDDDQNRN